MPSRDEHVRKAEGNEKFAATIKPENQAQIDWLLVVLFYTALHYIEAYLDKHLNQHVRSHTTRDKYVGKESNLRKIFKPYGHLKYMGYTARYDLVGFTPKDTQEAQKDLEAIKALLIPLL